jgi:hypothetical protein
MKIGKEYSEFLLWKKHNRFPELSTTANEKMCCICVFVVELELEHHVQKLVAKGNWEMILTNI